MKTTNTHPTSTDCVKGNHDTPTPFPEGITDLHLRKVEFGGLTFGGFNGSWKYKPRGHFPYEQAEATALIERLPAVDILVSHNSPRHVHDKEDETHYGFEGLNTYITRHQSRLLLHGHSHVNRESPSLDAPESSDSTGIMWPNCSATVLFPILSPICLQPFLAIFS
jgi:Icc-related predicted phosphoesterase